jgi:hypothetical protein
MAAVHGYNTPGDMRVFLRGEERKKRVKDESASCSVMGFLYANPEFSLFVYLVERASLVCQLSDPMFGCTVFVPTDSELMQKYDENTFRNISSDEAFNIVRYSTLQGKIEYWLLRTLGRAALVPKNSYDRIDLRVDADVILNNRVKVMKTDKVCSNGAVLFTDDLLIPHQR